MTTPADIQLYDITCGEKVQYGYYAALEVVFSQFLNELESYFFDEFNASFEFDYEIITGLKFRRFLEQIGGPQPIILFNLSPLIGDCLMIMENRSANLLLSREKMQVNKRTTIDNRFLLNNNHTGEIKATVEQLLDRFCDCWEKILPVQSRLKKLVTNKIKARVMSPVEACVVVRVNLKQNRFSTCWEFCFSDYQLDQVIKKYGSKLLLAGTGESRESGTTRRYFSELLLKDSQYQISGVLGELDLSEQELLDSYQNQTIIPLKSDIDNNAVVTLNDKPLLSASVGVTNEHIALQVNGKYERKKAEQKVRQKSFSKIRFPGA